MAHRHRGTFTPILVFLHVFVIELGAEPVRDIQTDRRTGNSANPYSQVQSFGLQAFGFRSKPNITRIQINNFFYCVSSYRVTPARRSRRSRLSGELEGVASISLCKHDRRSRTCCKQTIQSINQSIFQAIKTRVLPKRLACSINFKYTVYTTIKSGRHYYRPIST